MPGFEVIGEEEKAEILDVLSRKMLFRYEFNEQRQGIYKVKSFEKEFARYCGARHALAVSSARRPLRVALAALGVGPGDEVTPGVHLCGHLGDHSGLRRHPRLCRDRRYPVHGSKDLFRPDHARTRAILPVHMCGAQARIRADREIAAGTRSPSWRTRPSWPGRRTCARAGSPWCGA